MTMCVMLPAKDEALVIARTLNSILSAGIKPSDVYFVDDGSKDGTGGIATSFGVNVLRNEKNIGKAASIKKLTAHFDLTNRYDILTSMDADTMVHPNYYIEVRRILESDKGIAVVCGTAKSSPFNWLTAYRCLNYWVCQFIYKDGQSKMGVITCAPGCASTYRADVFSQVDLHSDTLVEDMDVTIQIHRKKLGKIVYAKNAIVYTQDPRTVGDYCKQLNRWQTGAWQVGQKYRLLSPLTFRKLDLEYKLMMWEGLVFSVLLLTALIMTPFWFAFGSIAPKFVGCAFLFDSLIFVTLSLICAVFEKRWDVFLYSPFYQPVRYLDCAVFLYSFWMTVIRKKKATRWFSVKRY